ncbi:hypothetical protein PCANC_10757 [Puccinia coronata f. sp. avenae]|uniref:Uncharacterized protein n=1 Tax=Puccinia coronata f. sp. avenae TaxID=200324 RepID=A0A2N5VSP2_9BASI|nr:hypothetical protein PCANC_10757 [Puccinia coronata f. sp. avenae]
MTMAKEVDRLIPKKTGTHLQILQNHIRCICHKIALILNAGLAALRIPDDGLIYSKEKVLGYVPGLAPITKESECKEVDKPDQFVEEDVLGSDDNAKDSSNEKENNNEAITKDNPQKRLGVV